MMSAKPEQNLISADAADALIAARDGDMALLYLYLCRTGSSDMQSARLALMMPSPRMEEAVERLEMCGLLPLAKNPAAIDASAVFPPAAAAALQSDSREEKTPVFSAVSPSAIPAGSGNSLQKEEAPTNVNLLHPSDDLPAYTTKDVADRTSDPGFSAILEEARRIVGRHLSSQDMIRLLGIYDHFDLPAEVVMELMHYVAEVYRDRYGTGRLPSIGAFEREARGWVRMNITDLDAAEAFIRSRRDRHGLEEEIKEILQIKGRDFTDTERRYVNAWLEDHYQMDVLAYAYDKTATNTGKFSPAYMNRILLNWKDKGLHTLKEIQQAETPLSKAPSRTGPGSRVSKPTENPMNIRSLVDKI